MLPRIGRALPTALALAALLAHTACAPGIRTGPTPLPGYVFTWIHLPLTPDLNDTPVGQKNGTGKILRIREPFSRYGIYAEFNSNAIGEIAQRHGMETVYFADRELFSILGIWRHEEVVIYGE